MADSNLPLDIEALNQLATRLRDDYVGARNPALCRDLDFDLAYAADLEHGTECGFALAQQII